MKKKQAKRLRKLQKKLDEKVKKNIKKEKKKLADKLKYARSKDSSKITKAFKKAVKKVTKVKSKSKKLKKLKSWYGVKCDNLSDQGRRELTHKLLSRLNERIRDLEIRSDRSKEGGSKNAILKLVKKARKERRKRK